MLGLYPLAAEAISALEDACSLRVDSEEGLRGLLAHILVIGLRFEDKQVQPCLHGVVARKAK